jgi:hypothetical protein
MPFKINIEKPRWITPTKDWQTLNDYSASDSKFSVDPNFFIKTKKVD